jgi:D-lactate dehydrogenase (cytochrome)
MIFPMSEQYEEYLIDESKFAGYADSISFPESEEEIMEILKELDKTKIPITIQGGKTGITGGAVPTGGHILNLSHLNQVIDSAYSEDGTGTITVQPGINLIDLHREIGRRFRKNSLFWPPEPTETSATVGGIAATGAQGISRLLYGSSRDYIERIRLMNVRGEVTQIGKDELQNLPDGRQIRKLDAVFGKEGITGIITELTLRLIPKPEEIWGIAFFFPKEEGACRFIDELKSCLPGAEGANIAAVEYLDRKTLDLIEGRKPAMTKIRELPNVDAALQAMVYIEIHGQEDGIEETAELLMEQAAENGSDPDEAWAVSGETEVEKLHAFRHGAAETANLFIEEKHREDPRITKLGTDMLLGEQSFLELLMGYKESMEQAKLQGCIFGHALENHLHVNLLPQDYKEYEKGREWIAAQAQKTTKNHGQILGEHGVGKLKRQILGKQVPSDYRRFCWELKEVYDPDMRINRGNILL